MPGDRGSLGCRHRRTRSLTVEALPPTGRISSRDVGAATARERVLPHRCSGLQWVVETHFQGDSYSVSGVSATQSSRSTSSAFFEPVDINQAPWPRCSSLSQYWFETTLDAVLFDGPHAFPFPQIEYFFLYPMLRPDDVLVIDDLQIPSVHDPVRFRASAAMFTLEAVVHTNSVLVAERGVHVSARCGRMGDASL